MCKGCWHYSISSKLLQNLIKFQLIKSSKSVPLFCLSIPKRRSPKKLLASGCIMMHPSKEFKNQHFFQSNYSSTSPSAHSMPLPLPTPYPQMILHSISKYRLDRSVVGSVSSVDWSVVLLCTLSKLLCGSLEWSLLLSDTSWRRWAGGFERGVLAGLSRGVVCDDWRRHFDVAVLWGGTCVWGSYVVCFDEVDVLISEDSWNVLYVLKVVLSFECLLWMWCSDAEWKIILLIERYASLYNISRLRSSTETSHLIHRQRIVIHRVTGPRSRKD